MEDLLGGTEYGMLKFATERASRRMDGGCLRLEGQAACTHYFHALLRATRVRPVARRLMRCLLPLRS